MNNRWLSIFMDKVQILVSSMEDINQLRREKVMIYHIKKHEDGYLVTVRKGEEKKLKGAYTIVRKVSIYPTIMRLMIPVLAISFFLIVLMKNFTIGYVIEGNLDVPEEQELMGLLEPHFKRWGPFEFLQSDLAKIEQELIEHYNDYVWVSINRRGNNIVFEVYDTPLNNDLGNENYSNTLYARRSGVIKKVDAQTCRVVVEVGQLVEIGDPLITCNVLHPNNPEQSIPLDEVAQGSVWAETWYKGEITFPKQYVEEMLTTRIQTQFVLNIGNWQIGIPSKEIEFENYETRSKNYDPFFFLENSPLFLEKIRYYEKSDIMKINELEDIQNNVYVLIRNEFANQTEKEFTIRNLEIISVIENENEITLRYHITIFENIAY